MIRYALKCANDHSFESWFQSADAFVKVGTAGMVVCPVCGVSAVEKAIMAPPVRPARAATMPKPTPKTAHPLSQPANATEAALARLRKEIESNSEYVGMNFATEARAIHDGDAPRRSIYGEAAPKEAKSLIEDGVPVAPLPFTPQRKIN
ncbi:MAG: DUF1178 family protein [Halocynthiibacter sp.]